MSTRWKVRVVWSLAHFLALSGAAGATVVYVNQAAGGATHDGSTWATAFQKIQEAVDAAHAGDEVWVAKGTYDAGAIIDKKPLALYGGFAGTETVRGQRNIRQNVTSITRSESASGISCNETYVTISGFRLRNTGVSAIFGTLRVFQNDLVGGGIALYKSKGIVTRNVVTGGGVYCEESSLDLTDNTISACTTGVYVFSSESDDTGLIAGNTITGNRDGMVIVLHGATVVNNIIAFNGGTGLYASPDWTILLTNNVYGNSLRNYDGVPDLTGQNGNISVDPRLTSIHHDVHLKPDSPCRDLADADYLYSVYDVDGQARIQGSGVDLGSDESDGSLQVVPSRTWYVSTAGSDANAGTSWAAAKATIAGALSVAQGGDEVWVKEGTYTENLRMPAGIALYGGFDGTETSRAQRNISAHLTIIAWTAQDRTVVLIENAWVRIDGFTIRGGREGVYLTANSVLTNCTVTQNIFGVMAAIGSPTLTDNFIADNSRDGVLVQNAVTTMTGNLIDWNAGNGILARTGAVLTMTRNVVQRNNNHGLQLEAGAWADVHSNMIRLNTLAQVWLDQGAQLYLHNNTLVGGGGAVGVGVNDATAHLINNIIAYHAGYGVRMGGTSNLVTMYGNDLFANSPNYDSVPPDIQQNNLSVDPLLVDYANYDYRLQPGSPLTDAGYDSVVKPGDLDLDGRPRIQGPHVDIGTYEVVQGSFATLADVLAALKISGGLQTATASDVTHLNVVETSALRISLPDAARLARKVAGLEANP